MFEQESADEGLAGGVAVVLWEEELVVLDFLVDGDGVVRVAPVRQHPAHHLVQDDPQRPDVHRERIPLRLHYLRRHVVRSPDYRESSQSRLLLRQQFSGAHVDHVQVAIGVECGVFWFEVAVDDGVGVEVLDAEQEAAEVEAGGGVVADAEFSEEVEEVAALDVLEQEVDEVRVLVAFHQFDDEGEVARQQDLLLASQELLHLVLHHHVPLHALQGVFLLAFLVLHQEYSPHLPLAQFAHDVEIFELDFGGSHSRLVHLGLCLRRFLLLYVFDRLFLLILEQNQLDISEADHEDGPVSLFGECFPGNEEIVGLLLGFLLVDDVSHFVAADFALKRNIDIFIVFTLWDQHLAVTLRCYLPELDESLLLETVEMAKQARTPQRPLDYVMKKQFFLGFASKARFQILTTDGEKLSLLQTLRSSKSFLIVLEAVFPKAVPILKYQRRFARNGNLNSPLYNDEEGSGVIPRIEQHIILFILESVHIVADGVPLFVGQKVEQRQFMNVGFRHFEVVLHHLPLDLQEFRLAEAPETAGGEYLHRGRPRGGVNYGEFAKKITSFHGLHGRVVDFDLYLSEIDDEEHAGGRALLENVLADVGLVSFHGGSELFAFGFGEFEEEEVFADGGLEEFEVGGGFGVVHAADILEDLVERQSSIHLLVLELAPTAALPLLVGDVLSQLQLARQLRLLAPHPQPTLFSKDQNIEINNCVATLIHPPNCHLPRPAAANSAEVARLHRLCLSFMRTYPPVSFVTSIFEKLPNSVFPHLHPTPALFPPQPASGPPLLAFTLNPLKIIILTYDKGIKKRTGPHFLVDPEHAVAGQQCGGYVPHKGEGEVLQRPQRGHNGGGEQVQQKRRGQSGAEDRTDGRVSRQHHRL